MQIKLPEDIAKNKYVLLGVLHQETETILTNRMHQIDAKLKEDLREFINNSRVNTGTLNSDNSLIYKKLLETSYWSIYLPAAKTKLKLAKKKWFFVQTYENLTDKQRIEYSSIRTTAPVNIKILRSDLNFLEKEIYTGVSSSWYGQFFRSFINDQLRKF